MKSCCHSAGSHFLWALNAAPASTTHLHASSPACLNDSQIVTGQQHSLHTYTCRGFPSEVPIVDACTMRCVSGHSALSAYSSVAHLLVKAEGDVGVAVDGCAAEERFSAPPPAGPPVPLVAASMVPGQEAAGISASLPHCRHQWKTQQQLHNARALPRSFQKCE